MLTTKKDFELFKTECKKWIDRFELNNYRYRYEHKDIGGAYASSQANGHVYTNTLALNTNIDYGEFKEEISKTDFIKDLAKHEVIHSLIGRLSTTAQARYIAEDELREAEEELVIKLSKII